MELAILRPLEPQPSPFIPARVDAYKALHAANGQSDEDRQLALMLRVMRHDEALGRRIDIPAFEVLMQCRVEV